MHLTIKNFKEFVLSYFMWLGKKKHVCKNSVINNHLQTMFSKKFSSNIYINTTWNQIVKRKKKKKAGSSVEPVKQNKVNGICWCIKFIKSEIGSDIEIYRAWVFKNSSVFSAIKISVDINIILDTARDIGSTNIF